jgi:hypothetical protein
MAFTFKLEDPDGTPADPPTIRSAVPNWEIGDRIPMGPDRSALVEAAGSSTRTSRGRRRERRASHSPEERCAVLPVTPPFGGRRRGHRPPNVAATRRSRRLQPGPA